MKWAHLHKLKMQNPILSNFSELYNLCKALGITVGDFMKISAWFIISVIWIYRSGRWYRVKAIYPEGLGVVSDNMSDVEIVNTVFVDRVSFYLKFGTIRVLQFQWMEDEMEAC